MRLLGLMENDFCLFYSLTGLTGLSGLFLFFLTSRMEVRKPNPPAAEFFNLFICATIYNFPMACFFQWSLFL
jgi:hypothetical protein